MKANAFRAFRWKALLKRPIFSLGLKWKDVSRFCCKLFMGFKAISAAAATLDGVEMVQMMRKRQGRFAFNWAPTLKEQFETIAA